MAAKIRLKRMGAKKAPYYRIVMADDNTTRGGKAIAELGSYDPRTKEVKIDAEGSKKWLANGAIPTPTVKDLLKKNGVL
ncbi:MAG: 30S ribosomal protein S16 [Eubacteriaceae bacterium]|nr:30S ribosomal protein S16 [Eubacteriaceae bacterium]